VCVCVCVCEVFVVLCCVVLYEVCVCVWGGMRECIDAASARACVHRVCTYIYMYMYIFILIYLHEGLAFEAAAEEGEEGVQHGQRGGGHKSGGEPRVVGGEAWLCCVVLCCVGARRGWMR
jgi:hypothetical protein